MANIFEIERTKRSFSRISHSNLKIFKQNDVQVMVETNTKFICFCIAVVTFKSEDQ